MKIVRFSTPEEKSTGLQWVDPIDPSALYVFPGVEGGTFFHSKNVVEPFDIAFLSADHRVLAVILMHPPESMARAPEGTALAIEARAGNLRRWGFAVGRTVSTAFL